MENICKNCGFTHTLNFCNNCGQKVINKRFTTKELLYELFHNISHFDKGLPYTMYAVLIRPHVVIKDYIKGATKKYTNPAQFAILLIAFATFFLVQQNVVEQSFKNYNNIVENHNQKAIDFQKTYLGFVKHNLQYFMLFFLPFFALSSKWLFRSYNYAEHLILNCYIFGLISIITLPTALLVGYYPSLKMINILITILLYAFSFHKIFSIPKFLSIIKSIVFYVVGFLLFLFSFFSISLIFLLIKKAFVGHAF